MYTPKAFRESRQQVLEDLIREFSFATVVSNGRQGLLATHLPVLLDADRGPHGTLRSHMARANPQWKEFGDQEVLVIFQGPHCYISPSWYRSTPQVPTWNYAAVHCYGKVQLLDDLATIRKTVIQTVDTYESSMLHPWAIDQVPDSFIDKLALEIIAFDIEIARIEGKWKFNQNRTLEDRQSVIATLKHGTHPQQQVAEIMRQLTSAPPQ